jgi:hypothetical protein
MTPSTNGRTLVLVAGSGRSGTSLVSGILQRLGFTVPQPEVPADATNPRGFAESQWVVDFHTRLLAAAGVQTADARPAAWADAAAAGLDPDVRRALRHWLELQFATADDVLIKDPRLSWFLPLWRRCAEDVGADPRFLTMLRHPAAVIESKQTWYGGAQGEAARLAGWVNQTLFTERATRESPRVFVPYEALLEDWTQTVARIGAVLDLAVVRDAPAGAIRDVHGFVDRSLSRSRPHWGEGPLPARLREQADAVWELVSGLAQDADADAAAPRLDALRADYLDLYAEAEAITQSSAAAAARASRTAAAAAGRAGQLPGPALWVIRRSPPRLRKALPARYRHGLVRALRTAGAR